MRRLNTILCANRAEIARRVLRTARALGYQTVAVYSEADRDLPHVREADRAFCIGAAPVGSSYLSHEAILAAAVRSGADAIHPGYGFLSENAAFAEAVLAAGLCWIGPPPSAMRAMGDKSAARALAEKHNIPTVPGFNGDVQDDDVFAQEAERIGYPVLIKASAGGGGRGMRRVERPGELREALASARREAQNAFGSGRLLLERYLAHPRHIEVQVMGDEHGHVVHLGERECSVQRRHQKIIEEAPSPGVDATLREKLGAAAVGVCQAVGYTGAGTCEFLVDERGDFFFLEMNTRLQVEHPVTELVTGLDLVALQIAVAEGAPLPFTQEDVVLRGHAIEVRLYAEDPVRDYLPSAGPLVRFDLGTADATAGLRLDVGYETGNEVGVHYDPMLGKLIAHGPDRATANRRLLRAVRHAWVPGLATNLPLLREVLAHPAWQAGELDTHFLGRNELPTVPPLNFERGALAATVAGWVLRQASQPWCAQVPAGFRLEGPAWSSDRWHSAARELETRWRTVSRDQLEVAVGDAEAKVQQVRVLHHQGDAFTVEVDGELCTWRIVKRAAKGAVPTTLLSDGDLVYVHLGDGESVVSLVPRHPAPGVAADEPGTCIAPMPGKVARVRVAVGDVVKKGDVLIVLEAMKMEHSILAPEDGTVSTLSVALGDTVDQGRVLARIEGTTPPE